MTGSQINAGKGQRAALLGIIGMGFLVGLKAATGLLQDCDLLVADALHNSADLIAIFATWIGLHLAARNKTRRFPYGFYRAETLAVLLISGLFLFASYELLTEGFHSLTNAHEPATRFPALALALAVSFGSGLVSLGIALYERKVGRGVRSASLQATAGESLLDVVASGVVCLGILLHGYDVPYVEGAVILGIGLMILKLGVKNIVTSVLILMDANMNQELATRMARDVGNLEGVKEVTELRIRSCGITCFVDLSFATAPWESVEKGHALADRVESYLLDKYQNIESVFTHVEPTTRKDLLVALPVDHLQGIDSVLSPHFGKARFFLLAEKKADKVSLVKYLANDTVVQPGQTRHLGVAAAKRLLQEGVDVVITQRIGEISYHWLRDCHIHLLQTRERTVKAALSDYAGQRLNVLRDATHENDNELPLLLPEVEAVGA